MDPFEAKVKEFIKKHQLLSHGKKVLVGVSGGPDSLALLYFLKRIQEEYSLSLVACHVDHMFRGEESYSELKYVQAICDEWGIPFYGTRINVPEELKKHDGANSQALARKLRYNFFRLIMEREEIPSLALAHHGDDQIETILMRLTRGASIKGIAGIPVKRPFGKGEILRPFLCVTKSEIEEYGSRMGLKPVYDPSNMKDIYTRNRFRRSVLPFLKEENQNVHIHFQRFSEELNDDDELLYSLAKKELEKLVQFSQKGDLTLQVEPFLTLHTSLQRRCIHLILNYIYKGKEQGEISSAHVENILSILQRNHPSKRLNLPEGLIVEKSYTMLNFTFNPKITEEYSIVWEKGDLQLPNGNMLVMRKYTGKEKGDEFFFLDKNALPLIVRTRKVGDRIELPGNIGRKKLKTIFIDRKIPISQRDEWPIITDREGRILWVPLLQKSKYEADVHSGNILILQYKMKERQLGGSE